MKQYAKPAERKKKTRKSKSQKQRGRKNRPKRHRKRRWRSRRINGTPTLVTSSVSSEATVPVSCGERRQAHPGTGYLGYAGGDVILWGAKKAATPRAANDLPRCRVLEESGSRLRPPYLTGCSRLPDKTPDGHHWILCLQFRPFRLLPLNNVLTCCE